MATKDYTQLAGEVVKAVGGKEKHYQRYKLHDTSSFCIKGRFDSE